MPLHCCPCWSWSQVVCCVTYILRNQWINSQLTLQCRINSLLKCSRYQWQICVWKLKSKNHRDISRGQSFKQNTVWCHYNMVNFCSQFLWNTSHSSPVRVRYGMYFLCSNCDLYSAWPTAVVYAVSCCIGLCYNGTRLYPVWCITRPPIWISFMQLPCCPCWSWSQVVWCVTYILRNQWINSQLTLLGLKPEYSGQNSSIPWLLMSWLLVSPGHQQLWLWQCRIKSCLSSMRSRKSFKHLCHLIVDQSENAHLFFIFTKINS